MSLSRSILPLLLLLLASCNKDNILSKVVEVDPQGWITPAVLHFGLYDIEEEQEQLFDMELLLRCVQLTEADSVELIVSTQAPDGVLWSEPFTIHLNPTGQNVDIVERSYRTRAKWSQEGEYTLSIQPLRAYRGITAVGANIIYLD